MELPSAARWEAMQDQTIAGLVGPRVHRHYLWDRVQGSGKSALVVARRDGWGRPRLGSHVEFPLLVFECFADPARDVQGLITTEDAPDKAWALYRAVNDRFHGIRDEWWGARGADAGLRIVTCERWDEPTLVSPRDVHTSEQMWMGDMHKVVARYAVETAH